MNVLKSIRSDLFSKRLAPLLILAVAGLAAAIAFGGGGSGAGPVNQPAGPGSSAANTPQSALSSIAEVTTNPNQASAETTSGTRYQNQGHAHDPFNSQPQTTTTTTTTTTPSSGKSPSSSSSTTPTTTTPKSAPPTTPPVSKPKPPQVTYTVNLEFGPAPTVPGEPIKVTTYKKVKVGDPIPSKSDPVVVLHSASLGTKKLAEGTLEGSAVFSLASAPILKGPGVCLPSTTKCESIRLSLGQVEELQVLQPGGETLTYLLRLTFVFKKTT